MHNHPYYKMLQYLLQDVTVQQNNLVSPLEIVTFGYVILHK